MKKEFLSRPWTKEYGEGWDYIFGKAKKKPGRITVEKWIKECKRLELLPKVSL